MGGYTGVGNIDADPLFADSLNGNFQITWANFPIPDSSKSPCIDAGDPDSPLDPDNTIADIGAFYFDQLSAAIVDLTITIENNDIILYWTEIPNAAIYHIYRSSELYFEIIGMTPIASTSEPFYTDSNALSDNNYFYRVTWED
jgi:hypothetical protein